MNRNKTWMGVALLGALLWCSNTMTAQAELEACGGVFLSGDANCEYRERESCMTQCTTMTVEKACVAKLYTSCENQCTTTSDTTCESSCSQGCSSQCQTQVTTTEPPNCMGLCVADCQQACDGPDGRRNACCRHTCNARCENKCANAPPQTTTTEECSATCTSACSGSCTAKVNVDCQVNCQSAVYNECETELVETCETKCMDEGGAIFCDGQFVNAANARSCADELKAKFNFEIDVRAEASAVGEGVEEAFDDAKEKGNELCTVSAVGAGSGGAGGAALLGLCATVLGAQRTRKRRAAREHPER